MKKLLMASAVLCLFSISVLIFQTSCSKIKAQTTSVEQINKIIYTRGYNTTLQIWTANYDGTNAVKVPLTLPSNVMFDSNITTFSISASPDGQTIFFTAYDTSGTSPVLNIYSCDISGNNLKIVVANSADGVPHHPVAI